jgi:hypothetical protein
MVPPTGVASSPSTSASQVESLPPLPPPSRPLGVAILAVLVGLYGILWIVVGGLLLAGQVGTAAFHKYLGQPFTLGSLTTLEVELVILIVGLIILGLALGLYHLRTWALALSLLFLVFVLVEYGIAHDFVSFGFLLSLVIFLYLLAVSGHFN